MLSDRRPQLLLRTSSVPQAVRRKRSVQNSRIGREAPKQANASRELEVLNAAERQALEWAVAVAVADVSSRCKLARTGRG